jgi:hypothetical protein
MHFKFYVISILFLIAVGACFLLIAFGQGPDAGIAADNAQAVKVDRSKSLTQFSSQRSLDDQPNTIRDSSLPAAPELQ